MDDFDFYGIAAGEWALAVAVALLTLAALWAVEWLATRRFAKFAARSDNDIDDVIVDTLRATRFWFLVLVALFAGTLMVDLDPTLHDRIGIVVALGLVLQGIFWANTAIRCWVRKYGERHMETDPAAVTTMKAVGFVARFAVLVLAFLVALETIGVEVTALIAGLGIGGIAIALAVQNILGDLFASLSIVLDKPFVIGDFIIVGDLLGTVEHIGLKTTRVRSLGGEQLVFSNSDLLSSRIRNFKRMFERRIVFGFGVTYQTPAEKLRRIPPKVQEIIEGLEKTRFDRAHWKAYGASSLDFEVVYYVLAPEYNLYMDIQQSINLALLEWCEAEGIDFAYPTQTLHVASIAREAGAPTQAQAEAQAEA